jgi:hypothetical protein
LRKKTTIALGCAGIGLVLTLGACGKAPVDGHAMQAAPAAPALFKDSKALAMAAKAGTAKNKAVKFSATVEVAGHKITTAGEANYDGANTSMSATMDMLSMKMELRFVGGDLYLKMPAALMKQMGITKEWAEFSPEDLGSLGALLGGDTTKLAQQNDPSQALDQIQKSGSITSSDKTQLDGQPVSHYVLDLDVDKMMDNLPAGMPAEAKSKLEGKHIHIPAELWLNADQLPVQETMDMSAMMKPLVPSGSASSLGAMKMTMKYRDWGVPVTIQAPPAAQVQTGATLPGKQHI